MTHVTGDHNKNDAQREISCDVTDRKETSETDWLNKEGENKIFAKKIGFLTF